MLSKNELATAISEYSHTMLSKVVGTAGAAGAGAQLSSGWLDAVHDALYNFPWLNTLSAIAVILLIIERGFIVWAAYRKHKRGD